MKFEDFLKRTDIKRIFESDNFDLYYQGYNFENENYSKFNFVTYFIDKLMIGFLIVLFFLVFYFDKTNFLRIPLIFGFTAISLAFLASFFISTRRIYSLYRIFNRQPSTLNLNLEFYSNVNNKYNFTQIYVKINNEDFKGFQDDFTNGLRDILTLFKCKKKLTFPNVSNLEILINSNQISINSDLKERSEKNYVIYPKKIIFLVKNKDEFSFETNQLDKYYRIYPISYSHLSLNAFIISLPVLITIFKAFIDKSLTFVSFDPLIGYFMVFPIFIFEIVLFILLKFSPEFKILKEPFLNDYGRSASILFLFQLPSIILSIIYFLLFPAYFFFLFILGNFVLQFLVNLYWLKGLYNIRETNNILKLEY